MRLRNAFLLFVGLLLIIPILNCGGGNQTPVISGTLPNGTVGTPYSGTLSVTRGAAPFTWNITGLPATLSFASSGTTVTISGTPLVAGTISGMATVTDSKGRTSASFPFSFTIAPAPTPVISGTLPNGFVDVPYSGTLTVAGGVAPFTWNLTGLPATLTFASSGTTVTVSGTPTAAATVSGTATVTDANGTVSAPFPYTFTIGPVPTLVVTPATLAQLTVGVSTSQVLTVSPATAGPYTWTVTAGSLPPGLSFTGGTSTNPTAIMTTTTNTVTIAGTPTTAGPFNFAITVRDSATPPNSALAAYQPVVANANANACPAGSNNAGLPAGTSYAFLLKGFDGESEPIVIAGSFTADGLGGITAGDVDFNGFTNGPQEVGTSLDTADSSYSFSLNNDTRGCLSLVFDTGAAAKPANKRKTQGNAAKRVGMNTRRAAKPEGVVPPIPSRIVFQFALGGQTAGIYTTGNIIEFDNADGTGTSATGVMHVQDPTAFNVTSLAPNFAFGVAGWDPGINRIAIAGSFALTAGVINPIFADFNDNGTLSGPLNGGANSGVINTISSTTGRATGSFDIPNQPGPDLQFDSVAYIINANDFYVISADNPATSTTSLVSGRALAASTNDPNLNGSYIVASEGFDSTNATNVVDVGTVQLSTTGNTAAASLTQNDGGSVTNITFTGTYALDTAHPTSGRVSFTTTGTATPPVLYVTNGGDGIEQIQAFTLGQDTATLPNLPNVVSGVLLLQNPVALPITSSSVSGTFAFGSSEDVDGQNGSFSGVSTLATTTATTGTYAAVEDATFVTLTPPFLTLGESLSGTFTVNPDGSGTLTIGTNPNAFVTNGLQIFAIPTSATDGTLSTYTNAFFSH